MSPKRQVKTYHLKRCIEKKIERIAICFKALPSQLLWKASNCDCMKCIAKLRTWNGQMIWAPEQKEHRWLGWQKRWRESESMHLNTLPLTPQHSWDKLNGAWDQGWDLTYPVTELAAIFWWTRRELKPGTVNVAEEVKIPWVESIVIFQINNIKLPSKHEFFYLDYCSSYSLSKAFHFTVCWFTQKLTNNKSAENKWLQYLVWVLS